jgi:hypothetical protein
MTLLPPGRYVVSDSSPDPEEKEEKTVTTKEEMKRNRRTARIVGVLILTATATYALGTGLIGSILDAPDYLADVYPNRIQMIIGVLLQFVNCAAVAGIGVLLFPILRKFSEAVAIGYVVTRIFDCGFLVVGGIGTLLLIALSQGAIQAGTQDASYSLALGTLLVEGSYTAYLVGMMALGLGSLPFCYLLYRSRLIPRSLSVLGLIGYAALLIGSSVELFGLNLYMIHYLPGGLFELILPIWLIFKGFDSSAIASESARADMDESDQRSLSPA